MSLKNTALLIMLVAILSIGSVAMIAAGIIVVLTLCFLVTIHSVAEMIQPEKDKMLKMETISNEPGFTIDENGELVDHEMIKLFKEIKNKMQYCRSRNDFDYCYNHIEAFKNKFDYMPYSLVLWEDLRVEYASVTKQK